MVVKGGGNHCISQGRECAAMSKSLEGKDLGHAMRDHDNFVMCCIYSI